MAKQPSAATTKSPTWSKERLRSWKHKFRHRYKSWLLGLAFLFIIVELVLIFPQDTSSPTAVNNIARPAVENGADAPPEQWMQGAELFGAKDGKKEWELKSEKALGNKGQWKLKTVDAIFYNQDNQNLFFKVKGDSGLIVIETEDMQIDGNVVIRSSNGYEFRTDTVRYDSKTKTLRSNDPVSMIGPKDKQGNRLRLKGIGLLASITEKTMDILNDVTLQKPIEDGRTVAVKSDMARFHSETKAADFMGQVVVDLGSTRITGPQAKFHYDSDTNSITSMEVEGGARLSDLDKWATAKKVNMSFKDDRFILYGSPKLVQNKEELVGDQIIFSEGGKRVEVKKGRALFDSSSRDF